MATAAAARDYQAAQAQLATSLGTEVGPLWAGLDPSNPQDTLPPFTQTLGALVDQYGSASAYLAAEFYAAERQAAGVRGDFTVPLATASAEALNAGIGWATRTLWQPEPDLQAVRTLVDGVAAKVALDTGRQTVIGAVHEDRKARAWARVAEPGCCAFCALLTTRGAVYRSQQAASFRSHDHCRCVAEPVFGEYELTAQAREWQALYKQSTKGAFGMRKSLAAFRAAYAAAYPASQ